MARGRTQRKARQDRQKATREHLAGREHNLAIEFLGCDLPEAVRRQLGCLRFGSPRVQFDRRIPGAVRTAIGDTYDQDLGGITVRRFLTHAFPIVKLLIGANCPAALRERGCAGWARSKIQLVKQTDDRWGTMLWRIISKNSGPVHGYVTVVSEWQRYHDLLRVGYHPPEIRQVALRSGNRPVFLVRIYDKPATIKVGDKRLPLFLQQHVIHRYHERMDVDPFRAVFNLLLSYSAGEYDPIQYRGGWLLPITDCRNDQSQPDTIYGYLPLSVLPDMAVATTFLFAGMEGAPQGDQLRRQLSLRRDDIEYHKLDRISTYLSTDLSNNPEVTRLLSDCGLRGLLNLGRMCQVMQGDSPRPLADEFLKYIGPALRHKSPV